jgi:hypothetical protein
MRRAGLVVATLALSGAAFLLAPDERAAPTPVAAEGPLAETTAPRARAPMAPPAGPGHSGSGAGAEVSAAEPAPPAPSARPALAISGRSHAEIRAALVDRSRERAIAAGKLPQWEERERARAESRERRRSDLEARRVRARARADQAREDARRIAAGELTRPQHRPQRDAAARGLDAGGDEQRAGDVPHVRGSR